MTSAIKKHLPDFAAVVGLFIVAAIVGGYILANQRLRFPFLEEKPYTLRAELETAQAVTPGQGQTVRVYGVEVGAIGKVELDDGRAYVNMDIEPKYKDLIHTDATALLRPKTGLKDMFLEVDPGGGQGSKVAPRGYTIRVQNTLPDVNPDEILSSLDADTRDYLQLLISDGGRGLDKRGYDLREVFRRFEPTHRDIAAVTSAVAERRANLRRLITSLNQLNGELASKDDELASLVDSSATVFRAFATEDSNVSATVGELPGALRQTTETLQRVQSFADVLGPAATRLRPVARSITPANEAVRPFAKEATPIIATQIRPFVREARPLVRELRPTSSRLAAATPDLTRSFDVLNNLFNMIGFNPNGREDASNAARQEGYLFSIAWAGHQAVNLFATADVHGSFRPTTVGGTCNTLKSIAAEQPGAEFVLNLVPLLAAGGICNS
jgi:phospholipid/cholesterol/gamma-HCH transport system substrate-binding protein